MGGLWEGQIRTARSILNALLKTHRSLNSEALHTLLIEVEAIVNSQSMTIETINDVQSHVRLSFSNLLTMKFGPADTYCLKRWRRTQHIVNIFWARWCKEFIQTLQERKLSRRKQQNFQKGDVVLLKANSSWNHWPIACIIKTFDCTAQTIQTIQLRLGYAVGPDQTKLFGQ